MGFSESNRQYPSPTPACFLSQARYKPADGEGLSEADPLGVHVEAFVEGEEDSRDETQEVRRLTLDGVVVYTRSC